MIYQCVVGGCYFRPCFLYCAVLESPPKQLPWSLAQPAEPGWHDALGSKEQSPDLLLYREPGPWQGVCVLRLATTTCGKADQVERASKDRGWRHCQSKCQLWCVGTISKCPSFLTRWSFGKGVLLIWMLAASCFHQEESCFYGSCCFRDFHDAQLRAPKQCLTSSWVFLCNMVVKISCLIVFVWVHHW